MRLPCCIRRSSPSTRGSSLTARWIPSAKDYRILLIATIILFVVSLMQERGVKIRDFVLSRPLALRWALLYAFIFFVLATFGGSNVAASGFMYAVF